MPRFSARSAGNMRVKSLDKAPGIYTCNSYLILGEWNRLEDRNTLIDPGTDGSIIEQIDRIPTGCGKRPVEQIILTHCHFDHAGGVFFLKRRYGSRVLAFCDGPDVDELIGDGRSLRVADGYLDVIHTPEHSSDSICLFHRESGCLFSGDTQLGCRGAMASPSPESLLTLEKLEELDIRLAYTGHNGAVCGKINEMVRESLRTQRRTGDGFEKQHQGATSQLRCT
jgi:glyoxylase-like metal-dependent hydrolase (beta-lactamase superfamily II)